MRVESYTDSYSHLIRELNNKRLEALKIKGKFIKRKKRRSLRLDALYHIVFCFCLI